MCACVLCDGSGTRDVFLSLPIEPIPFLRVSLSRSIFLSLTHSLSLSLFPTWLRGARGDGPLVNALDEWSSKEFQGFPRLPFHYPATKGLPTEI